MNKGAIYLILIIAGFGFSPSRGIAEELLTGRLNDLRLSYESAIDRATQPITDMYLKQLKSLHMAYSKSDNFAAAEGVMEEIKKVQELLKPAEVLDPTVELEKFVTSNKFILIYNAPKQKDITFKKGGQIGDGNVFNENAWKIQGGELYILTANSDVLWIFSFDVKTKLFKISETPHKKRLSGAQLILKLP